MKPSMSKLVVFAIFLTILYTFAFQWQAKASEAARMKSIVTALHPFHVDVSVDSNPPDFGSPGKDDNLEMDKARVQQEFPETLGNITQCKPIPGDPHWPSISEWQALNESISGLLISPSLVAVVCKLSHPSYDEDLCQEVRQRWTDSKWHGMNLFSSDFNDETCLPDSRMPCTSEGYPEFVINATSASHIRRGLAFAHRTGVRVIVKGTGHDFLGRSAGRNSLSIYTYNLRGIEFMEQIAPGAIPLAVKVYAGETMAELYAAADQHNVTLVGGADMNVGIGGWILNGGHSPVSSKYGLGADQVIEMEVVTANGTLLTINETMHADLFWAMRGGGGSTFGVMISVTMKVYPSIAVTSIAFSYKTTANSDTFWSLTTLFHTQLIGWNDRGVMGYYFVTPNVGGTKNAQGEIYGLWILPDQKITDANAIADEFEQTITNYSHEWADRVYPFSAGLEHGSFSQAWRVSIPPAPVGYSGRLTSRLLDRDALTNNPEHMKEGMKRMFSRPEHQLLGHVVAGIGVQNARVAGGSNSVLPAWREAIAHVVLPRRWNFLDAEEKENVTSRMRNVETEALRRLAPHSGAYVNEADPTETQWKQDFFGDNYPRLLEIKNRWDPEGVFWCVPCVGYDQWTVRSSLGVEGAIGQGAGRICRA